jgi:hypothetical protein
MWSTYLGGSDFDEGNQVAHDGKSVYMCGKTSSNNNISTPGSFQPVGGGRTAYYVGFLSKFAAIAPCVVSPITGPTQVCKDSSIQLLNATPGGTWSTSLFSIATINAATGKVKGISNGVEIITYTISPGCFAIYYDTVNVCAPIISGIATTNNTGSVSVYPNPASGELNINIIAGGYQSFTITSQNGQLIKREKISSPLTKVDIRMLAPGSYFITLKGNGENLTTQFVKK